MAELRLIPMKGEPPKGRRVGVYDALVKEFTRLDCKWAKIEGATKKQHSSIVKAIDRLGLKNQIRPVIRNQEVYLIKLGG